MEALSHPAVDATVQADTGHVVQRRERAWTRRTLTHRSLVFTAVSTRARVDACIWTNGRPPRGDAPEGASNAEHHRRPTHMIQGQVATDFPPVEAEFRKSFA